MVDISICQTKKINDLFVTYIWFFLDRFNPNNVELDDVALLSVKIVCILFLTWKK